LSQIRFRHLLQPGRSQEQGATCEEVDFMVALLLTKKGIAEANYAQVILLFNK
jgi:hypothetical protein